MLHLKLPTDPRWAEVASKSLEEILTDHAYCEQKAASNCISLIQRYPDHEEMVEELSPIVTEEWGHFRMVLQELKKRNLKLGRQRKDEYVNQLAALQRQNVSVEERLLDKLLTAALIEARSCERFRLLSEKLEDPDLRNFYHHFMESEAGHYVLFMKLAKTYLSEEQVEKRWQEFLEAESGIIQSLALRGDRMHG